MSADTPFKWTLKEDIEITVLYSLSNPMILIATDRNQLVSWQHPRPGRRRYPGSCSQPIEYHSQRSRTYSLQETTPVPNVLSPKIWVHHPHTLARLPVLIVGGFQNAQHAARYNTQWLDLANRYELCICILPKKITSLTANIDQDQVWR